MGIGEAIVDGVHAAGAGVSEIRDLNWRGLAGEDEHAIVGHMEGQVDKDVDLVGAYEEGQIFVGQQVNVAPGAGLGADFGGEPVGLRDVGIADDVESVFIVMGRKEAE